MSHNQNGLSKTRLYRIHRAMNDRCYKEYDKFYADYGGRGITVCDDWLGADGFLNFYNWALSSGYEEGLSIDRKDVNGNYEPTNCRWITMAEQQRNKRNNVYVEYNGEKRLLSDVAKELGVPVETVRQRMLKGRDVGAFVDRRRKVVRDDGVIYDSIREAAKANGVSEMKVGDVCRGVRKRTAGHGFSFLTRSEAEEALAKMGGK